MTTLPYHILDAAGVLMATTAHAEDAAMMVSALGHGAHVQNRGGRLLWTEGKDGAAGESYDEAASVMNRREGMGASAMLGFHVHDETGEMRSLHALPGDAVVMVAHMGPGSTVRSPGGRLLWTEGIGADGLAEDDFSGTANVVSDRFRGGA